MTLPNVTIPPETWVDLYALSGATVGSSIVVQNLGTSILKLSYSTTEPTDLSSFINAEPNQFLKNTAGDGAWVYSYTISGLVAVMEG